MTITQQSPWVLHRGFLHQQDPVTHFPPSSELSVLDLLGSELPALLKRSEFRSDMRALILPEWSNQELHGNIQAYQHLYYLRLGFLASAYINQVGQPATGLLPENLALPLVDICQRLNRPPILSYDGYALYNWYRLDMNKPVQLGNIDTLQNFVDLYDEKWFILVHVEIKALAAEILEQISTFPFLLSTNNRAAIDQALHVIAQVIGCQEKVLRRIPEHMDPAVYYKSFRPYIRFFEQVRFEGVDIEPINHRGETGAQSSIMPTLVALMKIPHQPSQLTNHLLDMRRYMPATHRAFIEWVETFPDLKPITSAEAFNAVLEAMAGFRRVHYHWAQEYIEKRTEDPLGTGGTPYMPWLKQLIDETLAHRHV